MTRESFQQHLEADHRHPLQRHLEGLIFPLPRKSHLQIHLKDTTEVKKGIVGLTHEQKRVFYSRVLNDLMLINLVNLILGKTNPISSNWQWVCCVHVLLPIITRLPVSKDLHLEVPHHGVHHLPGGHEQ